MNTGWKRLAIGLAAGLGLAGPVAAVAEEIQVPAQTSPESAGGGDRPREPIVRETFGSSDIQDWYAPDDRTLIIRTYAHGNFKGTFATACSGIRYTDSLGFSTQGPFELDRSTVIVLPHGERCFFRDLSSYSDEDEQRDREAARARPAHAPRPKKR